MLAGDKVVGRETATAQRFYYHTDLLGSTRVVVQGATVVEAYDYDPWGVRLEGRILAGPTKEGFTTKERDAETGLDYFGARYYMAALGRWGVVDPLAEKHREWSPYNYVLNNPLVLIDPDGDQVRGIGQSNGDDVVRLSFDGLIQSLINGVVGRAQAGLEKINRFIESLPVLGGLERGAGGVAADGTQLTDSQRAASLAGAALEATPLPIGGITRGAQQLIAPGGKKVAQQIARFRAAGGTGGPAEFLQFANDLAGRARAAGDVVTGTVGRGPQAIPNAVIFREGRTFLVVDEAGVIRSFVPNASPGGIVDEFVRLGGSR